MTWIYAVALLLVGGVLGFCVGAMLAICAEDAREERQNRKNG